MRCDLILVWYTSLLRLATVSGENDLSTSRVEPDDASASHDASKAILVAVPEGSLGETALLKWSAYLDNYSDELPTLLVLCPTEPIEHSVLLLGMQPFRVDAASSWATTLERFLSEHDEKVLGFFGEGSLPHPGLIHSIKAMSRGSSKVPPTAAVVARSRSDRTGEWLPDTFVAQAWVTRAMLAPSRLATTELDQKTVKDMSFLEILPLVIQQPPEAVGLLVDGTNVLGSTFMANDEMKINCSLPVARDTLAAKVYIGTLKRALRYLDSGAKAVISRATWPPRYLLEHVATEDGVVIVNNVNCGYLDMAVNFMLSVERTSGEKVLFVAMDEVSFDFMDAVAPGCVTFFPLKSGTERLHARKAGSFGDPIFASETLVRPKILRHIAQQHYTVLWSDSDIVWIRNPLELLPDRLDPSSADVMVQRDKGSTCTCFIFLKPTSVALALLKTWEEEIANGNPNNDQISFQGPLAVMVNAGLNVEYIPGDVMPYGMQFFDHEAEENYAEVVKPEAKIAHNNFIKGHDAKRERFQRYHLWWVDYLNFPECQE